MNIDINEIGCAGMNTTDKEVKEAVKETNAILNKQALDDAIANVNKELNEAIEAAKKSERNYVSGSEIHDILWRNLEIPSPVNLLDCGIWIDNKGDKIDV